APRRTRPSRKFAAGEFWWSRFCLSLSDSTGEAFVRLLAGEIVIVPVIQQMIGRFVFRRPQFLRHFLHRSERVRNKDRGFTDSLPDESRACGRAARTFDDDRIAVFDPCRLGRRGMNLNQPHTIHLLTGIGPLGDSRKMDYARPPDYSHQWILFV